ncbi:MAG: transketolase [Candidatus Shapirobacteria bacterium]|nr:transketolase [Candidatus Shapirobacteria bacterium]
MNLFSNNKKHPLSEISRELRIDILDTVFKAGFGHIGGSLSSIDILVALYFSKLFDFNRDHFILSAGHLCLSHYAILAKLGKFPKKLLDTYSEFGSILQGHESIDVPGVEYSSGSLGQGLSFAAGLALGDKDHHTVCLTTDGEHNEGQIWETVMFANKYHLGNLINIVDCNGIQIGGYTDDIMPLKSLAAKYIQNGWTVTTVNGHDFNALHKAIIRSKNSTIYPACIIAKTISGSGISFMEKNPQYHDVKSLPQNLYLTALDELNQK